MITIRERLARSCCTIVTQFGDDGQLTSSFYDDKNVDDTSNLRVIVGIALETPKSRAGIISLPPPPPSSGNRKSDTRLGKPNSTDHEGRTNLGSRYLHLMMRLARSLAGDIRQTIRSMTYH